MDELNSQDICEFHWLNGRIVRSSEAKIPIVTHGLQYATVSSIEGIRWYDGQISDQPYILAAHAKRMFQTIKDFNLPEPEVTKEQVIQAHSDLMKANGLKDGNFYFRPIVWLGPPDKPEINQMYVVGEGNVTHIAISVWPLDVNRSPLKLQTEHVFRRGPGNTVPILGKTPAVFPYARKAQLAAKGNGFDDAQFLDVKGDLADNSAANNIFVIEGELCTPAGGHILLGLTLLTLVKLAKKRGWKVKFRAIAPAEIAKATEGLACGTAMHTRLITLHDAKRFPDNQPKCQQLIEDYELLVVQPNEVIDEILGSKGGVDLINDDGTPNL